MPRRIKSTRKTRHVYCEGAEDMAFLMYLKSIYATSTYSVDIKAGTGGDQVSLANKASLRGDIYDEKYLKIDDDRHTDWNNSTYRSVDEFGEKNNLIILKSNPMLEKLLVKILEPKKNLPDSQWKYYFESTYIRSNSRTNVREYQKVFPKEQLDLARKRLPELQTLIDLF